MRKGEKEGGGKERSSLTININFLFVQYSKFLYEYILYHINIYYFYNKLRFTINYDSELTESMMKQKDYVRLKRYNLLHQRERES